MTPTQQPWEGRVICQYRLVREIGRGGMAIVYCAEDMSLKRRVALKLFPERVERGGDTVALDRYVHEARSAAALDHENIVRIYEIGHHDQWHFIAMEFVPGSDLASLLESVDSIDVRRACGIGAEVAQALAYAHRMGVVHRDIKPANLILGRNGMCKVTDFGLAERVDEPEAAMGQIVGTPCYMAPEVARGNGATSASDIYSLGATLWHLLAGQPVFKAPSVRQLVMKHIREPPPNLLSVRPDVGEELATVLERALAKRPQERWSAEQFSHALWGLTVPVTSSGATEGLPEGLAASSTNRRRARRESFIPLLALVLGLLVAVGAIYAATVSWMHPARRELALRDTLVGAEPTAPTVGTADDAAPRGSEVEGLLVRGRDAAPDAHAVVHVDDEMQIRLILEEEPERRHAVVGRVTAAGVSSTGRSFRIHFSAPDQREGFYAVAFPDLYDELNRSFNGDPSTYLQDREVAIVGVLSSYRGRPQIVIDQTSQVRLLDEQATPPTISSQGVEPTEG